MGKKAAKSTRKFAQSGQLKKAIQSRRKHQEIKRKAERRKGKPGRERGKGTEEEGEDGVNDGEKVGAAKTSKKCVSYNHTPCSCVKGIPTGQREKPWKISWVALQAQRTMTM